jgi:hypothetical protein
MGPGLPVGSAGLHQEIGVSAVPAVPPLSVTICAAVASRWTR